MELGSFYSVEFSFGTIDQLAVSRIYAIDTCMPCMPICYTSKCAYSFEYRIDCGEAGLFFDFAYGALFGAFVLIYFATNSESLPMTEIVLFFCAVEHECFVIVADVAECAEFHKTVWGAVKCYGMIYWDARSIGERSV